MGAYLKLRITDIIDPNQPAFIQFAYTNQFGGFDGEEFRFNFVANRSQPFEATIGPNLNQALKDAVDLDLVPSGEWETTIDDYYIYIETTVNNRALFFHYATNLNYTVTIKGNQDSDVNLQQSFNPNALLNAFNSNVIIFSLKGFDKFNVTANDELPGTLYPAPNGEYFVDLKDYATVLINQNLFEDGIVPDIQNEGYVYSDPSLFLELNLKLFKEAFDATLKFYFLKSVAQIANYKDRLISESHVLLPLYGLSHKVTYYEGYPFDIPVFCNVLKTVNIKNKTTGLSTALDFNQYVNRLFLSQGSQNFTIDDVLPLQSGFNRLELDFGNNTVDLVVNKKESLCAPYFKFYRNSGGWGYIRFNQEVAIQNKIKDGKEVRVDFGGIHNTLTRTLNEGKETTVEMECYTDLLEVWEMENFKDFVKSPRVEMYTGDLFQKQNANSWIGVRVNSSSLDTTKRKTKKNRERVKIEFTEYNLHL